MTKPAFLLLELRDERGVSVAQESLHPIGCVTEGERDEALQRLGVVRAPGAGDVAGELRALGQRGEHLDLGVVLAGFEHHAEPIDQDRLTAAV